MTDRTVTDRQEAPGMGRRAGVHVEERADPALEGDTSPVAKAGGGQTGPVPAGSLVLSPEGGEGAFRQLLAT